MNGSTGKARDHNHLDAMGECRTRKAKTLFLSVGRIFYRVVPACVEERKESW